MHQTLSQSLPCGLARESADLDWRSDGRETASVLKTNRRGFLTQ